MLWDTQHATRADRSQTCLNKVKNLPGLDVVVPTAKEVGKEIPTAGGGGKIGRTGEVCRDISGTGGAVGGLGIEGWAGAIGGGWIVKAGDLITVPTPPKVGSASPGGA